MKRYKTLHVMPSSSRNTTRLMDFMGNMRFSRRQVFLIYGRRVKRVPLTQSIFSTSFIGGKLLGFLGKSSLFFSADKIIVHGFFNTHLAIYFLFFPCLLKKVYWVVWGGDLYKLLTTPKSLKKRALHWLMRSVLSRVNNIITYVEGDFEIIKRDINPQAKMTFSLMYPGNLYKPIDCGFSNKIDDSINILVGNSGANSNNHRRIFKRLSKNNHKDNIKVFCPLSYGKRDYIESICVEGKKYFGDNFVPLMKYMDLGDYVKFLSKIDYAVFDYDRQQGMGNIISLLGLGKGVFLNPNTTAWRLFDDHNIDVLNVENLDSYDLSARFFSNNQKKVKAVFSPENLQYQLHMSFD